MECTIMNFSRWKNILDCINFRNATVNSHLLDWHLTCIMQKMQPLANRTSRMVVCKYIGNRVSSSYMRITDYDGIHNVMNLSSDFMGCIHTNRSRWLEVCELCRWKKTKGKNIIITCVLRRTTIEDDIIVSSKMFIKPNLCWNHVILMKLEELMLELYV